MYFQQGFVDFYNQGKNHDDSPWAVSGLVKYGAIGVLGAMAIGALLQRTWNVPIWGSCFFLLLLHGFSERNSDFKEKYTYYITKEIFMSEITKEACVFEIRFCRWWFLHTYIYWSVEKMEICMIVLLGNTSACQIIPERHIFISLIKMVPNLYLLVKSRRLIHTCTKVLHNLIQRFDVVKFVRCRYF